MSLHALSPWTAPKPDLAHQAQIWHARGYASWLLSAGAEPRFGALLSSGSTAEQRWAQLLQEQGVLIERCQITPTRPLPQPLTQHRGDHFNRKLFLLEGLDELSDEALIEVIQTLNGQRNPLKQSATWVTLLFRSGRSLSAFARHAPHAWSLLERRCLLWESSERGRPKTAQTPPSLPRWAHPLEELFVSLDRPDVPLSGLAFDRCVRAGVQRPPEGAHERWRGLEAIWRGDVDFNARRRSSGAGVVASLGEVSEEEAYAALLRYPDRLSAGVRVQLEGRLSPASALLLGLETSTLSAPEAERLRPWASLRASLEAGAPPSLEALKALEEERARRAEELGSTQALYALTGLWIAEAYALNEALEPCLETLEAVERDPRCALEERFYAGERLVELYTLTQARPEAQAMLKELSQRAQALGAPLYEVRAIMAKAKHLGALDPSRGDREVQRATRLALLHGVTLDP